MSPTAIAGIYCRRRAVTCLVVVALPLLFLQLTPFASAQTELATVSGRVTDATGAVVPNAEIEVKNVETNVSAVRTTNADGIYTVRSLHPGRYVISARKTGFKTVSVTGLTLNVQDSLARNFQLEVGSISESVTVVAESEHINTADATVGTVVERRVVEDMPLNGRSFQGLITLTPGVAAVAAGTNTPGQFVVNGQRTDTSYFTLDGVSANTGAPIGGSINAAGT